MKNRNNLIRIGITIILALALFYIWLPAINLKSPAFYEYLLVVVLCYFGTSFISFIGNGIFMKTIDKNSKELLFTIKGIAVVIILIIGINFICSPLFNSNSWSKRIKIDEDTNFTDDVKEVDFNQVPLLDKESSQKLGDRVMGQMSELVSQFYVSNKYTQINYNNEIVRVTPLEYNGIIKWFNNKKKGITGYIKVNSVNGETELVRLDDGMKYMPSAYFMKNLERHLRFRYPTTIFGNISFEIDNEGNPYWVVPTIKYTGIGTKKEISGIVLVNPINGDTTKYKVKDVPKWIDQVYTADLIIEQIDHWGLYKNGFFNSIFSQNGVVQTTTGYNYLVQDDDVYMYTGITSVSSDESNIGFVLTNLRTKVTNFYKVPGAEEYSAMASAEGQVQQMKYKSSFPLLINLKGRPTYLMSLKDNAGLVKMYAFVDVNDYQKVVVSDSSLGINNAAENYINGVNLSSNSNEKVVKNIIIKDITSAIIEGNTYYFIVDNDNQKYKVSIKVNSNKLPFIKSNDQVEVTYNRVDDVIDIISIK